MLHLLVLALAIWYLYTSTNLFEGFTEVVKHGIAITNPPPVLPSKTVPWKDNYTNHSRNVHNITRANVLVNYPPMQKPPATYEETVTNGKVDVARAQFVPMMAKV